MPALKKDTFNDLQKDREIARQLARTWPVFFESFGRLTAVQQAVIPEVLQGRDVLVCSATASGKTEAACAPLVERNIDRTGPWTILYVSPTRALVNDLFERLLIPLTRLNLFIKRRTGDHRDPEMIIPHVLLTTPESFDSLLCRGRTQEPAGHFLSHVTALVLDEIHLLWGTPRGEQVRWLIERLRRLRKEARTKGRAMDSGFQVVALSATLAHPEAVAAAFLPRGSIAAIPGSREIETVTISDSNDRIDVEHALPAYLASLTRPEKVLVFSNSRRRVDELAANMSKELSGLGYQVGAHHGSLSKKMREDTEEALKTEGKIVVFTTSTLEIGIDIGDIDLVVLDGPPPDTSSLLQRIGRGNRHTGITRVMTCTGSPIDAIVQAAMIEAAREGWLGVVKYGPSHAVARQQVASYLFQSPRRSRSRGKLQSLVDCCAPPVVARGILDAMVLNGELEVSAEGILLGEEWLEQTSRGRIHSTIETGPGATIADEESGAAIASGVVFRHGAGLRIGGQFLQVRKWSERKIEVRKVFSENVSDGEWSYYSKKWVKGPGQPQTVRRYLGITEDTWPVIHYNSITYAFHFGGAQRRTVINLAFLLMGKQAAEIKVNEWFLQLPEVVTEKPSWLVNVSPGHLEMELPFRTDSLEKFLGRPLANKKLPLEARIDEVRGWLNIEEELVHIKSAKWNCRCEKELESVLCTLVESLRG